MIRVHMGSNAIETWRAAVSCVVGLVMVGSSSSALAQRPSSSGPLQLQAVATVGCASCGDFRLLSNVLGITLAAGDSLYVLDAMRPKVRVFRRDGRRIASVISEGREPGQVVLPTGLVLADTLAILVDGALDRVTVYQRGWTYLHHYGVAATPVAVAFRQPFSHFFIASVDYASGAPTVGVWRAQVGDTTLQLVRTLANGFPRDRRGQTTSFFAFAMTPEGGFVIGEGAHAYLVRFYDRDGNPGREITRDVERSLMTGPEHVRALERRRIALRRASSSARIEGGSPGPVEELALERNHFSATALRFDTAGRLWIKTDRGGESATVFDVYETSGVLYAEVVAPVSLGWYDVRNGFLAGLAFDPLDVPIVRVFRIRGR